MATQADKVNTGALATTGIVLALSTFAIAAALTALVRYETANHGAEKGVHANLRPYRDLIAKQRTDLEAQPSWVNKDKQLVSVPVERAMELVLSDLRKESAETGAADGGAPADTHAALPGDGGAPTANEVEAIQQAGTKAYDSGRNPTGPGGGVTPAEALEAEGKSSNADVDRAKAPKKPAPTPPPAPGNPQGAATPGGNPAPTH